MNYLKEVLAFHSLLEINQLDSADQALWFHLIHINNKCGWAEWFTVANMSLQARLGGIDKKTLERHRVNLINSGLIEYKNQGKKQAGKYRLIEPSSLIRGDIGGNIPPETTLSVPYLSPETPPLNKQKHKQNKPPKPPKEKPVKKLYGEFVELTEEEYSRLLGDYGEEDLAWMIQRLDIYLGQNSKNRGKYTSHNHVLRGWVADRLKEDGSRNKPGASPGKTNTITIEYGDIFIPQERMGGE